jgi:glycosyltransferase involved in cell wall biosynthesis
MSMDRSLSQPRVSVVLPVYNGAADVRRAIDSILSQTFRDLELIVIDDGSTDATPRILDEIGDPRVRVFHQRNCGLPATLNRAIELCRADYVARQDHDDLALPTRLERQVSFMDAHTDCGLLGTRAEIHVGDVASGRAIDHPLHHPALCFELLFDSPFVHSSVMLRKTVLEAAGGYSTDPARQPPEDYELWSRIARGCRVANLPERLQIYREVPDSLSRVARRPFEQRLVLLSAENLAHCLGAPTPTPDMIDLAALTHSAFDRVSARPDLGRLLSLVERAAERIDPHGSSRELAQHVVQRQRCLWLQYRLRSRLAQNMLRIFRAARRRVRPSFRYMV